MYTYKCTVTKIIDGDTIDVDINLGFDVVLTKQRIRLMGIDTPESRTRNLEEKERGLLSKAYMENKCPVGSSITLKSLDRGKFGRILGEIWEADVDSTTVEPLNKRMITDGFAVEYYGGSKDELEAKHMKNKEIREFNFDDSINFFSISGLFDSVAPISKPNATYEAPVNVAISQIKSGFVSEANANASAIMSLPSASVFKTSIVLPFLVFKTSPGLIADPLIIFSTIGVKTVNPISRLDLATKFITPHALAAPDISVFIVSIPDGLFSEYPPVSNRTPLPIKAT